MSIRIHEERVRAHLDELRARAQERSWVVQMLGDLHRTDNFEPPWFSHGLLAGRVLEDERVGEARVRCGVARMFPADASTASVLAPRHARL